MGRPQEQLERDNSPVREFAYWLRDLRDRADLTYEQVGKAAHYATSTVQAAAAGKKLPTLRVALAFVSACDGDPEEWRSFWWQIRRELDRDAPGAASILPPWAEAAEALRTGSRADLAAGWFTVSCKSLLRLDTAPAEVIEQRVIVAAAEGLGELDAPLACGAGLGAAQAEVLYGGRLREACGRSLIELPRALWPGERHEYAVRVRVPAGEALGWWFGQVPVGRMDRLEARVRFREGRRPRAVWRVAGMPAGGAGERGAGAQVMVPDRFGEVGVRFSELRAGLRYGVGWRE
jgi:Helix-turn-helix domain